MSRSNECRASDVHTDHQPAGSVPRLPAAPLDVLAPTAQMLVDIGRENRRTASLLAAPRGADTSSSAMGPLAAVQGSLPQLLAALSPERLAWFEDVEFPMFTLAQSVERLAQLAASTPLDAAAPYFTANLEALMTRATAMREGATRARAFYGLDEALADFFLTLETEPMARLASIGAPLLAPRVTRASFWEAVGRAGSADHLRDIVVLGTYLGPIASIHARLVRAVGQQGFYRQLVPDDSASARAAALSPALLQFLREVLVDAPTPSFVEGLLAQQNVPALRRLIDQVIDEMRIKRVPGTRSSETAAKLLEREVRIRYLANVGLALTMMYVEGGAAIPHAAHAAWRLLRAMWTVEDPHERSREVRVHAMHVFSFEKLVRLVQAACEVSVWTYQCEHCGFQTLRSPDVEHSQCVVCDAQAGRSILGRGARNTTAVVRTGVHISRLMR